MGNHDLSPIHPRFIGVARVRLSILSWLAIHMVVAAGRAMVSRTPFFLPKEKYGKSLESRIELPIICYSDIKETLHG